MIPYILVLALIILLYFPLNKIKNGKKIYCIVIGIILYLLMALSDPFLGNSDTLTVYYPAYKRVLGLSLMGTFKYYSYKTVLFYVLAKIISIVTTNYAVFLAICYLPISIAVPWFIYKRSKEPAVSFVIYFSFLFYFFSFIVLKHAVALGFLVLALDGFLDNKMWKYILFTVLATLFHYTAAVFIVLLLFRKIKYTKVSLGLVVIISFLCIIFKKIIRKLIFVVINKGIYYEAYINRTSTASLVLFFILLFFLIFCYIAQKYYSSKIENRDKLLWALSISCISASNLLIFDEFLRVQMFFSISMIILIPNVLYMLKKSIKDKKTIIAIYTLVTSFFILYCFGATIPNLNLGEYKSLFF